MNDVIKPKTLQEAVIFFADLDNCLNFIVSKRWPNGVVCPTCGRKDVVFLANRRKWQCKSTHDHRQFSIKTGTIFEDSPITLDKWLVATWLICNDKNGISSYEVHRALGITQKTAWFMMHRIRIAFQDGSMFGKMSGQVEVDETFIGGKARNMHKSVKARKIHGSGPKDKTVVVGILERKKDGKHSRVHVTVVPNNKRKTLHNEVRQHVEAGSALYSDALQSYVGLEAEYAHEVVDHAVEYVRGKVHTNGTENFWSLTKRCLHGTYISVEPFHLFRYLDEQMFRFNHRGNKENPVNDFDRFEFAVAHIVGRRLTWNQLTGKELEKPRLELV